MYKFVNTDAAASPKFHNIVKAVLLLCLLGILPDSSGALDLGCNYRQKLENDQTYFVYNSRYPNMDLGERSCRWSAQSDYRVRLSCVEVDLPCSRNCTRGGLTVSIGNGIVRKHCGTKWFVEESIGNSMVIDFTSSRTSTGSKFLCQLQALVPEDDDCRCGWKNPTRIVGGEETGVNEYPMMVGLVDTERRMVFCGGAIITPLHILTAAHCVLNRAITTLGVLVGEHNLSTGSETNATKLFKVYNAEVHPKYDPDSTANDLAIVTIQGRIEYTNKVGPACLPFQHRQDSFFGNVVTVLGWGTTEFGGPRSDVLQKADLYVISTAECRSYYGYEMINSDIMCTYGSGRDSCQMDSGGPLQFHDKSTNSLTLVALVSGGVDCGGTTPALNARPDVAWIMKVTQSKFCMKE